MGEAVRIASMGPLQEVAEALDPAPLESKMAPLRELARGGRGGARRLRPLSRRQAAARLSGSLARLRVHDVQRAFARDVAVGLLGRLQRQRPGATRSSTTRDAGSAARWGAGTARASGPAAVRRRGRRAPPPRSVRRRAAASRAARSTRPPRLVLTRTSPGLTRASRSAPTRYLVSAVNGQWSVIASLVANSSSSPTGSTPAARRTSSATKRVVGDDLEAEAVRPLRHRAPDPPEADDPEAPPADPVDRRDEGSR